MRTRCLALLVVFAAACGRSDRAADTTRTDTLGPNPTLGAAGTSSVAAPGDPPPPPIDTTGTMFLIGAAAATRQDSATIRFNYDTAAAGTFKATFQASATDSVTVDPNTSVTGGGSGVTGTGRITVRKGGATIVADLSKGIGSGSSLGKCQQAAATGRGRCGTVMLDSVQYTPSGGKMTYRKARIDLGH